MKQYEKVYETIFPEKLCSFLLKGTKVPFDSIDVNGVPKNFPPALIPFWRVLDGNNLVGLWKHWFVESRQETIVFMSSELCCKVREIARNLEQLLQIQIQFQLFVNQDVDEDEDEDLGMTNAVYEFANSVGISDMNTLREIVNQHADNQNKLMSLQSFSQNPPLNLINDSYEYRGDFFSRMDKKIEISRYCSLEITNELLRQLTSHIEVPWLTGEDQEPVFDKLMGDGEMDTAWLCLNSSGWTFPKLKASVENFIDHSHDELMTNVLTAWLSCPHDLDWGY